MLGEPIVGCRLAHQILEHDERIHDGTPPGETHQHLSPLGTRPRATSREQRGEPRAIIVRRGELHRVVGAGPLWAR
jgi:hypothetical protein